MRNESAKFGRVELGAFFGELLGLDREHLVQRLEACVGRLEAVVDLVPEDSPAGDDWSPHEVMAHIAVLTKYYGVLTYQVSMGTVKREDLLSGIQVRDELGARMSSQGASELGERSIQQVRRTIAFLREVEPRKLRRRVQMLGLTSMSAEEICRLSLCTHLEQHLGQLEAALGAHRVVASSAVVGGRR
jgi:hypothetical protein